MQCDECGREFRPARWWQHFCSPHCRDTYHNRRKANAAKNERDERYRCEVLAYEVLNGTKHLELVANPPPPMLEKLGPTFGLRGFGPKAKKEESEVA
jgi:hypothetical protein